MTATWPATKTDFRISRLSGYETNAPQFPGMCVGLPCDGKRQHASYLLAQFGRFAGRQRFECFNK